MAATYDGIRSCDFPPQTISASSEKSVMQNLGRLRLPQRFDVSNRSRVVLQKDGGTRGVTGFVRHNSSDREKENNLILYFAENCLN